MATLSTDNKNKLQHAIDAMVKTNATELPFDATIIEQVGRVAVSSGFESAMKFQQDCRDNPISTLLRFAKFLGT